MMQITKASIKSTDTSPKCPHCHGCLTAKFNLYVEQRYGFVGDEGGDQIEVLDNSLSSIQCGTCCREWSSHDALQSAIEHANK